MTITHGRGVALAAIGHISEARTMLQELERLALSVPTDTAAGQNTLKDVLAVAIPIVRARVADSEQRSLEAISLSREAVTAEDHLAYDEPRDWFFPARQLLGAAVLRTGAAPEAESVYREDLLRNVDNGWSLYGLAAALRAEGKTEESREVRAQFKQAWKNSDTAINASAF